MDIIVRQVLGGFQAGYHRGTMIKGSLVLGPLGKTRDEAIGKMVLKHRQLFQIGRVIWDRKDEWTERYLAGKLNRRASTIGIDYKKLSRVRSSEEAKDISFTDVRDALPVRLQKGLILFDYRMEHIEKLTLGVICQYSKKEIKELSQCKYLGPKTLALLEELVEHYGLSLKK